MRSLLHAGLLLAAATVAACGGSEKAKPEPQSAAQPATPETGASGSPALLALLPKPSDVPGWDVSKAPRSYDANTLFELIDGAADGFLTYGFQEVVAADYTQAATGDEVSVEVYRMKDPLNAFGKYSEERDPAAKPLDVGTEGYSGGTTVNFWKGAYYVKLTAFEDKPSVAEGMATLATSVAGKITSAGAPPTELSWFPTENQVARSAKFIPRDVLAQSYLSNGFEVRYKAGAKESRLVLVAADSPAAATEALGRYRQAFEKSAKAVKDVPAPGEGGFTGADTLYGNVTAVRSGKYLAVSLGAPSDAVARAQLAALVKNVT